MAALVGHPMAVVGDTTAVHDTALNPIGTPAWDAAGNQYIYLKGLTNCVTGFWVTYDEVGVTVALAANAIGPVAIAMAAILSGKFGWFCVCAMSVQGLQVASSADNETVGRETTDGHVGDGRVAGDEIYNAFSRGTATGLSPFQIRYPFVDDVNGA